MRSHVHNNNNNTGENPDIANNVTGAIQPYKEYVDKWNMGFQENLFEVQEGDSHINQVMGATKNPFSGVEDTSEFETVDEESVEPVLGKTPSPSSQQENDRPIRTQKPVLRLIPVLRASLMVLP